MRALLTIASFEVRGRLKRISTWVYFGVFFIAALMWTAAAGGAFVNANIVFGSGKVWINSPYAVAQTVALLGVLGLTVIAALSGRAVQQDIEYRSDDFFFTAPIGKGAYLFGRYIGAVATLLIVFSSIALGALAGTLWPNLDAERLGPLRLSVYAMPYATILLPNLLWLGALFFTLAALSRRMLPVYIASVVCLVGYLASTALLRDIDNKTLAALIDPFGLVANARVTEYWPIAERNTRLIPLDGVLLWNRLVWLAVGAVILVLCYFRFRRGHAGQGDPKKRIEETPPEPALGGALPTVRPQRVRPLALLPRLSWLYFRETVKNIYFFVIALSGVLFVVASSTTLGAAYGTNTWPVTYQMLGLLAGTFGVFMLVIIAFYAGELAWRERDNRLDQIHDALPIPTWLPFVAKLVALMLVPALLLAVLMVCGIAIQTAKGYYHYQLGLYLYDMFTIDLIDYWLLCVLALAVHSIVNQKYVGHFVMIAYYVAVAFAATMGFEHHLYQYGTNPGYTLSDMNGYGHFLPRVRAFQAYYAAWALLLALAAYLFWTRGTRTGWGERLRLARARFGPRVALTAAAGALGMAALGGFIFYNTNVLNPYRTAHDMEQRRADYEKRYKPLALEPQPKITAVNVAVDLYPREQRVRMHGRMGLQNRSDRAVENINLFFVQGEREVVHQLAFGIPATLAQEDAGVGLRRYKLAQPLAPGATTTFDFDLEVPTHGFTNNGSNTAVVYNGSFVNGGFVLPVIGYNERGELADDRDRRKFGLAPKERMRDRDDPAGLAFNYLTHEADWITYETQVSTDADQWAIAPGYLEREWVEGDRHHFSYKMDSPILDFFAYQSARYAVRKDRAGDVPIEIYYQPGHEYNLDRMIASVKDSLAYYNANFGPYQHKQFRIIEFPRYAAFAQAFPNTIPYSEAIGFIARVRENDKDDIDYPYYVTAHEAAHQWWAHQVIGGDVQGSTMLSESFAQYSALMVMKHKYGGARMQKFLAYELDRYLIGRATEQKKELPLARVENQPYIHYNKGSLVMYALQDYIGEEAVNRALHTFRDATAYKGPPYTNVTAFLGYLRRETPPEYQYLIEDLFETITLYDNRAVSADAAPAANGRYDVTVVVEAKKRKADALGKEDDVPIADLIDIGVLDANGTPLFLEKRKITDARQTFTVSVTGKPARAGIDPLNKLIDRHPRDNTIAVDLH